MRNAQANWIVEPNESGEEHELGRADRMTRAGRASAWRFRLTDSVCNAGDVTNEDRGTALDRSAWVLDGTTGLDARRLFPGPSDAAWFAATADEILYRLAPDAEDGEALMRAVVAEIGRRCTTAALVALNEPGLDVPAASLAFAHFIGDRIETVMLGDCKILLARGDGGIETFDHSTVARFDAAVMEAMQALQRAGETDLGVLKPKLFAMIRENRKWKNRPGGYSVLSEDPACLAFLERAQWPAHDVTQVLLASDGFYRLVDVFGIYTPETLLAAVRSRGLRALYDELRRHEAADPACLAHPRVKPRDDTTALLLAVDEA